MLFQTRDFAHYVYLFRDQNTGTYKIGVTQYIGYRPTEYRFHGCLMEVVLYARFVPLCNNRYCDRYAREKAYKLETYLCKQFSDKAVKRREWFDLTDSDVEEIASLIEYLCDATKDNDYMAVRLVRPTVLSEN